MSQTFSPKGYEMSVCRALARLKVFGWVLPLVYFAQAFKLSQCTLAMNNALSSCINS